MKTLASITAALFLAASTSLYVGCHKKEPFPVKTEYIYQNGTVIREQAERELAYVKVITVKKAIKNKTEITDESTRQTEMGYRLFLDIRSSKDIEYSLSVTGDREKLKFLFNKIKPGDKIQFIEGIKTNYDNGEEDQDLFYSTSSKDFKQGNINADNIILQKR